MLFPKSYREKKFEKTARNCSLLPDLRNPGWTLLESNLEQIVGDDDDDDQRDKKLMMTTTTQKTMTKILTERARRL